MVGFRQSRQFWQISGKFAGIVEAIEDFEDIESSFSAKFAGIVEDIESSLSVNFAGIVEDVEDIETTLSAKFAGIVEDIEDIIESSLLIHCVRIVENIEDIESTLSVNFAEIDDLVFFDIFYIFDNSGKVLKLPELSKYCRNCRKFLDSS